MSEELIKCPSCQSAQLSANKKGFSLGKAAVGGVALGPVGLLAGTIGSAKIKVTCLSCGYEWIPSDIAKKAARKKQEQETDKFIKDHPIISLVIIGSIIFALWKIGFLGWLFR